MAEVKVALNLNRSLTGDQAIAPAPAVTGNVDRAAGASARKELERALQQLRRSVLASDDPRVIVVMSCFPGEGVSTIASGLAGAASEVRKPVVFIDASDPNGTGRDGASLRAGVNAAREKGSSVVVDGGSLQGKASALDLYGIADGVVLVIEAGRCHPNDASEATDLLRRSGLPVLGAVINRSRPVLPAFLGD
ncbi:MAG: hypothetical protein ACK5AZ_24475 [Bryobacteraceae bacterium]